MKVTLPKINNPFLKKTPLRPSGSAGQVPTTPVPTPTESVKTDPMEASRLVGKGITTIKDIIAPSAIEIDFDFIKMGNTYFRTLFVSGYPRFVNANWLYPLISFDHSMDISMFIYPRDSKEILDNLRRKIGEMEATIQSDTKRGRVIDPSVQVALDDALSLQQQLAKGAERFFQFGLYVTIPAETIEELEQVTKQVKSTLGALLIVGKNATLQMDDAFKTTIPLCTDRLMVTRNMDTTSLATTFPFTSSELTANEGILYGINEHNDSLIIFDRFTLEKANTVVLGKSGGGKSVSYSTEVLVRQDDKIKPIKIGELVDKILKNNKTEWLEKNIEGVINPGLEVYSFNNNLKSEWSKVTVAARKNFSPRNKLYKITTASGREITITADHNLVLLRGGKVRTIRSEAVKVGERIPLSRFLPEPEASIQYLEPKTLVADWPNELPDKIDLNESVLTLLGLITSEGYTGFEQLSVYNTESVVQQAIISGVKSLGAKTKPILKDNKTRGFHIQPAVYKKLLAALDMVGNSGTKRAPFLLFSANNKRLGYYLKGYYSGDGCVEKHKVTAMTKSKQLASDLCYLLLRFGIIARIHPKIKRAANTKHAGDTYYEISISGQQNIQAFAQNIGFLQPEKNLKLKNIINKNANTNVDLVPNLEIIFKKLYKTLYSQNDIRSPANFTALMRGVFSPSREELNSIIKLAEKRVEELKTMRDQILLLKKLPNLNQFCDMVSSKKRLNHLCCRELGESWRLMKNKQVVPGIVNVLRAYRTVSGQIISVPEIKHVLLNTFSQTGSSLQVFDNSLWTAVSQRKDGDTSYDRIYHASQFIIKRYRSLQLKIRFAEEKLADLKLLANSDLFWDPIEKIEKINHQEKYVYDLTVDNEVFLAGTGGMFVHNSYLVKLEAVRSLMFGSEIIIIDPEDEYKVLCDSIGGQYISFSFSSNSKINPFDLSGVYEEGENELGLKILSLHGLFKVIMGQLNPSEDALLDRAIILTYKQKDITPDPTTQKKEPPLMEDLYKTLIGMEDVEAKGLADRIEKFIKGSLSGIFDQKSTVDIKNTFTVFSIKELEDELRPIAMYIILDYIWTRVKRDMRKRILIVDEAWYMMKYPDSANFLYSIAKRARKYFLGLTTITQDIEDFLNSDHGKAIVNNSSMQILLKQSPASVDVVSKTFYLSEGEKHLLLAADVGEGLFFAGLSHVAIRVVASPDEHKLITSRPEELLAMKKDKEAKIAEENKI